MFAIVDFLLLAHFAAMLGLHSAITYTNSRTAVANSLGTIFFLMVGILHLQPAILIVAFHNRWSGLPLILTLIGWGWLIKGSLYLMFPRVGLMSIGRVSIQRSHEFVIGGVVLLVLTALIAIPLLRPLIG